MARNADPSKTCRSLGGAFVRAIRGAARQEQVWPVVGMWLLVAVPTVGVLWFVGVGLNNQRLATKQRLLESYQHDLSQAQTLLSTRWQATLERLANTDRQAAPSARFARLVAMNVADSFVCASPQNEVSPDVADSHVPPPYPALTQSESPATPDEPLWEQARQAEFQQHRPALAAESYETLWRSERPVAERVQAVQGLMRCLLQLSGKSTQIWDLLDELALLVDGLPTRDGGRDRPDVQSTESIGVLVDMVGGMELRAIENLPQGSRWQAVSVRLQQRLANYQSPCLSATRRLFLSKRCKAAMASNVHDLPTLAAEQLALEYLQSPAAVPDKRDDDGTTQSSTGDRLLQRWRPGSWCVELPADGLLVIANERRLAEWSQSVLDQLALPAGVVIRVQSPPENSSEGHPTNKDAANSLLVRAVGREWPGWRLQLTVDNGAELDQLADDAVRVQAWIGGLVVLFTVLTAVLIWRNVQHQLRLARLKNDLLGTVSHELKTPLASLRLLVDTLLESPELNPQRTRDYLQLMQTENLRLSRLIDNFLTFSRLEQQRQSDYQAVSVQACAQLGVDAVRDRWQDGEDTLTLELPAEPLSVWGDEEELVTVLVNLLDNARKYSAAPRHVRVWVELQNPHGAANDCEDNQRIAIHVQDNGCGIDAAQQTRIFERFYQVDQRLSRRAEGCGLGLSIVQQITESMRGRVTVVSQPDEGSTFTVWLPTYPTPEQVT